MPMIISTILDKKGVAVARSAFAQDPLMEHDGASTRTCRASFRAVYYPNSEVDRFD